MTVAYHNKTKNIRPGQPKSCVFVDIVLRLEVVLIGVVDIQETRRDLQTARRYSHFKFYTGTVTFNKFGLKHRQLEGTSSPALIRSLELAVISLHYHF